jgi:hypothetical protein
MPFFRAKVSHFVGALGLGRGFHRGRGVGCDSISEVGFRAREMVGPSGVLWMSQWERSVFKRDWVPSRAMVWSSLSERVVDVVES